ncbi:MAG: hypothetical protein AAF191_06220, partial [Verrucomicrobiota bacterium]
MMRVGYDPNIHSGRLRRLDRSCYCGKAWVHWTMAIEDRRTGWLTEPMHRGLREGLLHSVARHELICPMYCLMPDHGHFIIGGLHSAPDASDQRLAIRSFRREWN